jgi:hypothetical protein
VAGTPLLRSALVRVRFADGNHVLRDTARPHHVQQTATFEVVDVVLMWKALNERASRTFERQQHTKDAAGPREVGVLAVGLSRARLRC